MPHRDDPDLEVVRAIKKNRYGATITSRKGRSGNSGTTRPDCGNRPSRRRWSSAFFRKFRAASGLSRRMYCNAARNCRRADGVSGSSRLVGVQQSVGFREHAIEVIPHTLGDFFFAARERPQDLALVLPAFVFPDAQEDGCGPTALRDDQRLTRFLHAAEHIRDVVTQVGDRNHLGDARHGNSSSTTKRTPDRTAKQAWGAPPRATAARGAGRAARPRQRLAPRRDASAGP